MDGLDCSHDKLIDGENFNFKSIMAYCLMYKKSEKNNQMPLDGCQFSSMAAALPLPYC